MSLLHVLEFPTYKPRGHHVWLLYNGAIETEEKTTQNGQQENNEGASMR